MKTIRIRKGFDLNIDGKPSQALRSVACGGQLGVLPERIPFVKPRLLVKEGDAVQIGSPLYEDKRNTDIKFLSPGGGVVRQIKFGRRRLIQEVIIALDAVEPHVEFETFTAEAVEGIDKAHLIRAIMAGGLWCLFKAFPFGDMPQPDQGPPAIIVALDSKEPFHPLAEVYLQDRRDLFNFGLRLLGRLTETVVLSSVLAGASALDGLSGRAYRFQGPYPAGDPGVLLYRIKKHPAENRAWAISGQDLLLVAALLKYGRYPTERVVALGGGRVEQPQHLSVRLGIQLKHLIREESALSEETRAIAGGLFRGYKVPADSFLGLRETSLLLVPEGHAEQFFGFARPGYDKASYSRAFLSKFRSSPFDIDCALHGEERACINCGYCAEVCAVDILPQFAMKTVLAGEVEEALAHGLLDCVSCGLCTYVCPSKIDICDILKTAKAEYHHEVYS